MAYIRQVMGEYGLYDRDVTIIKKIGDNIKVCNLITVRKKGLVINNKRKKIEGTKKMENSLSRSKSMLREYALCNPWDYFCTFTIDKEKYDRNNLKAYYRDFSKFINNYNRYCSDDEKVKYMLVPEQHKDGAWHMHGLLKGIKASELYINQNGYIGWTKYEEKFGYISFGKIRDIKKTANYVMKYITKDSEKNVTELGCHVYYCSKGLNKAELLYRGKARLINGADWDFETPDGFCKLKNFDIHDRISESLEILED